MSDAQLLISTAAPCNPPHSPLNAEVTLRQGRAIYTIEGTEVAADVYAAVVSTWQASLLAFLSGQIHDLAEKVARAASAGQP